MLLLNRLKSNYFGDFRVDLPARYFFLNSIQKVRKFNFFIYFYGLLGRMPSNSILYKSFGVFLPIFQDPVY